MDMQAGLLLRCSHAEKSGFLASRVILFMYDRCRLYISLTSFLFKMQPLIRVSTICLQNVLLNLNKNEKYHPMNLKTEMH